MVKRIRVTSLEQIVRYAQENRRLSSSIYGGYKPIHAAKWLEKSGKVIWSTIQTGLWLHEETK